ncbi:hypothetical protein [Amycolatopsis kentuckyensis]|uniref:hypothetical protein n=1 Tax=Amycolatopsis kentuckyensis TaxID=218823 RepID=UPI000A36303F|nr:hypothetical protein [Amycolatopsis kentuckyensis]
MRRLSALSGVLLVALSGVACGANARPGSTSALCSASYEPRELVVSGPLYQPLPTPSRHTPAGSRTTDAAAIRKIAATACDLPEPPADLACTADLGPSFELRFLDTQGRTTTLTAAAYSCQFVDGLETRRYGAKPLWAALAAAGLPAPRDR